MAPSEVVQPTQSEVIARSRKSSGDPTFALALGGGGARGLAHVHVIEALNELAITPVAIAGSSIGAIMGAGMASGLSGREIRKHAHFILGNRSELAARVWRARPGSFAQMMEGGLKLGQFSGERILAAFLPDTIAGTFEELQIPLKVTATDYFAHHQFVFETGDLSLALCASSAIPAVFKPVEHQGLLLIDGGISNPVPFDLLDGLADIVIAIDVVGGPSRGEGEKPNSVELLFGASQIMMQSIIALKLEHLHPDILIKPPVSHFGVLDFMRIENVLGDTVGIKDELKRAIHSAVERLAKN